MSNSIYHLAELLASSLRACEKMGFAVISGALLLPCSFTFAAENSETQYRIETWKTERGLPQNTVKALHQSKDGYLWFGTRFGIVRFDGMTFRVFDRINTHDLAFDNCIAVTEEADGRLWFAMAQGVVSYKNGTFTSLKLNHRDTEDRVWSISTRRQGGIWVATANGLDLLTNGELTHHYSTDDGLVTNAVTAILEDTSGTLWVGTPLGLQQRDPATGKFTDAWKPDGLANKGIQCLYEDAAHTLWVGTAAASLVCRKGGQWTGYTTEDGLPGNSVSFITADSEGDLWIVVDEKGLFRFHDGRFTPFGEKEGLNTEKVMSVFEDREGDIWIGTEFGGLKCVQRRRFRVYSTQDGLPHYDVWSISESRKGGVWVGTKAGFSLFKDGKFNNYRLNRNGVEPRVKCILEDRKEDVWIGTLYDGLFQLHNGKFKNYTVTNGLAFNQVHALYEDKDGILWIGTLGGLNRFKDGIFTTYVTTNGLSHNDVRGIRQDRNGDLWFATYGGGVNRLHAGRFTSFTTRNGLSDNLAWSIYEDSDGALWIGTENGLNRLQDGRITQFTRQQGLFDNVVNDILEDQRGFFWISCNRGIYRVSRADLNAIAEGKAKTVQYVSYGISDGMLSSETNGENQPDACKTRDGRLWFPTTDGIVVVDPSQTTTNVLPPQVVIEDITMDRKPLDPYKAASLPPGRGDVLELRYTANSLVAPEKVQFRYCLYHDGHDDTWTEAGNRRVAYYTNLRPGNYTFRVIACNNHGVWNEEGASYSFFLAPHFYQTWLFYLLCSLTVVLAGYGLHWIRLSVVRKIERLEKQHALEKERARIANEMHDDLGSSLTQIALLGELANRDLPDANKTGEHIQKITRTTREVFRAMDEIVWAVNPKHDTLSSLIGYLSKYAQDFLRPAGIRCRLDLPQNLPPHPLTTDERHNLFLTVKEALNNIVKHAGASEVWLRVSLDSARCLISIEDNGRGFAIGSARPDGNGLTNMRERLAATGGEFKLNSQPGQGTRLELIVLVKQIQRASLN